MPRPSNKEELVIFSSQKFSELRVLMDSLPNHGDHWEFPKGTMNRNIRDVLMHLHHWHLMMLKWYEVGMNGEKPDMPSQGFTWKTVPQLNEAIWNKSQDKSLREAKGLFESTHEDLQNIIHSHTEEELFQKKKYHWTGSTSLASYLISATSSHYDWALKLIKKAQKTSTTLANN